MRHRNLIQLSDVAKACRLSVSTVSKILGPGGERYRFPPETAARVREAARQLGWKPVGYPVRASRSAGRRLIGFVSAERMPYGVGCFGDLAADLSHALHPHGLDLVQVPFLSSWRRWVEEGREDQLAGAVMLEYSAMDAEVFLHRSRLPLVLLQHYLDLPADRIEIEHQPGAEALAGLVVGHGHRVVLFVTQAVPRHGQSYRTREGALRRALAEVDGQLCVAAGVVDGLAMLDQRPDITAVVTFHEQELPGLMHGFAQRGIVVPRDLSVASLGGAPAINWLCPLITHLETSWGTVAQLAAERLVLRLSGEDPPPCLRLVAEQLVDHGSVGPPAVRA